MDVVVVNVAIVIYGPQLQSKQQAVYYLIGNDTKDTLQAVGFSCASGKRNHCEQLFGFLSTMCELPHILRDALIYSTL